MIQTLKNWNQAILEHDLSAMPKWKAFLWRVVQIFLATIRDIRDEQLSLRAMSLVYTTLITLVPLLAISFSVLKGFGAKDRLEPLLMNILEGLGPEKAMEVTERVIGFVENINVGVLGGVGLLVLFYAVIAMLQKIEIAFNHIWRVGEDRNFAQRFSDYLSVLVMGPVLIFISSAITTTVRSTWIIQTLTENAVLSPAFNLTVWLVPWLVMALGFTFVYIYMPNTKVKIFAGFAGALVAALLWKTMGFVFASFISGSTNYVSIYAAFATLIVLMFWLYASWFVVLIGANVAFYTQNPHYISVRREPLALSPYLRMIIGLSALSVIAKSYYKGEEGWTTDRLSKKLNVPILAISKVMSLLEQGGILTLSDTDPKKYYPALPFGQTPLEKAIEALEHQGRQGWLQAERMNFSEEAKSILNEIKKQRSGSITSQSIAEALAHIKTDQPQKPSEQ